jgi:hypothetical protein
MPDAPGMAIRALIEQEQLTFAWGAACRSPFYVLIIIFLNQ